MSNPYYRIYLKQVFNLAKTLVIKSVVTANAINKDLEIYGHIVDIDDMTSWKYYMNMAGLYHNTDSLMQVKSLDNLEVIDFTIENLIIHKATAIAYGYGTRYYTDLVSKYKDRELLILGILNPIDVATAIDAADGTILYYNPKLVEVQEYSFIERLQKWIYAFSIRWNVPEYGITDEYYAACQMGILFANLPMEILNCRLEACLTAEAHSFHVKQYLASHGALDKHLPYLSLKQSRFLYRNIKQIQNNVGKQKTFKLLLDNIITERNLPLFEYEMVHNVSSMPDVIYPEVTLLRNPLNDNVGDGLLDSKTVSDLLIHESDVAKGNVDNYDEAVVDIVEAMENSPFNTLPVKVYESAVLDSTDVTPFSINDILLNHWLYFSHISRYMAVIDVPNPSTGKRIILSVEEAFALFIYTYNKAVGATLIDIPSITARRVRKLIQPTLSDVRAIVDTSIVSDEKLESALSEQPVIGEYISVDSFQTFCSEQHAAMVNQYTLYAKQEDKDARAMLSAASSYVYQDIECDLYPGEEYNQWLADRGIEIDALDGNDLLTLANSILIEVGIKDISNSNNLKDLQKSLLDLMSSLSSYSVHYLQTINISPYHILDIIYPRFRTVAITTSTDLNLDIRPLYVDYILYPRDITSTLLTAISILEINANKETQEMDIPIDVTWDLTSTSIAHDQYPVGRMVWNCTSSAY